MGRVKSRLQEKKKSVEEMGMQQEKLQEYIESAKSSSSPEALRKARLTLFMSRPMGLIDTKDMTGIHRDEI